MILWKIVKQTVPVFTDTQKIKWNILQEGYMSLGKINLITPPDKLFNMNLGYLLVKPSVHVKQQFQTILSHNIEEINVFIYDENEHDVDWLLSVANQCDVTIIDVDNCDPITQKFITYLLAQPNTHYITNDEITPYGLINKNRIYNLDWMVQQMNDNEEDETDE
jgi:hypothetical protein